MWTDGAQDELRRRCRSFRACTNLKEVAMTEAFDVNVVGARCAGSRQRCCWPGRVTGFSCRPRDFSERHGVHPHPAPSRRKAMSEWGLLNRLITTRSRRCTPTPSISVPSRLPARRVRTMQRSLSGAAATGTAAASRSDCRQPEGNGRLRQTECRHDLPRGVLRAGERKRDDRRRGIKRPRCARVPAE